jgi:hypothetical protein
MKAFVLIVTFAAGGAPQGDRTERIAGFDDYQYPPPERCTRSGAGSACQRTSLIASGDRQAS